MPDSTVHLDFDNFSAVLRLTYLFTYSFIYLSILTYRVSLFATYLFTTTFLYCVTYSFIGVGERLVKFWFETMRAWSTQSFGEREKIDV